jgi:hypothetical protein
MTAGVAYGARTGLYRTVAGKGPMRPPITASAAPPHGPVAQDGPGLVTCMGSVRTERLLREAGFRGFEPLDIRNPTNLPYAARPLSGRGSRMASRIVAESAFFHA